MEKTLQEKNEKTYEQWLFDVKTIRPSYPEGLLKEAIFGSLKGSAADIARGLGPETTVDKVLELLDGVFGRKTNLDMLKDFYNPDMLMHWIGYWSSTQNPSLLKKLQRN